MLELFGDNFSLGRKVGISRDSKILLSVWEDKISCRESFRALSLRLSEDLKVEKLLQTAPLENILVDDLFGLVDRKIITELAGQIRDNQTGISYDLLFGAYLLGATEITVTDPYIRLPFQMRNFMELLRLVLEKKAEDDEIRLHLKTFNTGEHLENAINSFTEMADSLEPLGLLFTWEFDPNLHDRTIELNNGWKVILGRGLDIFQKTSGRYDIAEYAQEKRLCRECEVVIVKSP